MASLFPVYLKQYYKNEAIFSETKIVTSVYNQPFSGSLDAELINKIKFDGISNEAVATLETPDYENLMKTAINHSDAVIIASEDLSSGLTKFIESSKNLFYLSPRKKLLPRATLLSIKVCYKIKL
jgi:starch synthase